MKGTRPGEGHDLTHTCDVFGRQNPEDGADLSRSDDTILGFPYHFDEICLITMGSGTQYLY